MGKLDLTVSVYGAEMMLKHLSALRAEVEGVRLAQDLECIHRMRVASRRLRAAQAVFDDSLPRKLVRGWERIIQRVTRSLGRARDLDIQIEAADHFLQADILPSQTSGLKRLLIRLRQERQSQQGVITEVLDKLSAAPVISEVELVLNRLVTQVGQVYRFSPYLYLHAFQNIIIRLDGFLSYQELIVDPINITELHAMRIAGKKLRYTLEIFSSLYPANLSRYIQAMRDIQEMLGSIHDCDVWVQNLPMFLAEEQERIVTFYGIPRGYSRLLPGIHAFQANRQALREQTYSQFMKKWSATLRKGMWNQLREELQVPFPGLTPSAREESSVAPDIIEEGRIT